MKDKVANVFLSSLGLFQLIVEHYGQAAGSSTVQQCCHHCLPLLLEKLGDNNPKLRSVKGWGKGSMG